jgi:hypothetical protein
VIHCQPEIVNKKVKELWKSSCDQLCDNLGFDRVIAFLKEEQNMILKQKKNFIIYTDFYKKMNFLLTFEHYKINKGLIKDSSKLDETDCVLCFTAITCLSNPIIYCSKCERGAHRICLRLDSVPNEDFFCVACTDELNKKGRKKEKEGNQKKPSSKKVSNWMKKKKRNQMKFTRQKGILNEKIEKLLVDRSLLIMKNKNVASRTEDINRILSSKLEIRFDGKLFGISDKWVHMEVSSKVIYSMIYALIKINFNQRDQSQNGLILDLIQKKLYLNKTKKENQVLLDMNNNYNLEEWVYSNKYCMMSKANSRMNYLKDDLSSITDNWDEKIPDKRVRSNGIIEDEEHKLKKQKGFNVKKIMMNGESNEMIQRDDSDDFEVFKCENMLILKKYLENDDNLRKCLKGDEVWINKIRKEITHEIKKVVYLFRDCRQLENSKQSLISPMNGQKSDEDMLKSDNSVLNQSIMYSENNFMKKPKKRISAKDTIENFRKPKRSRRGTNNQSLEKNKLTYPNEYVVQNVKFSKLISLKGDITDDIRLYKGLSLCKYQNYSQFQLELSHKFEHEIALKIIDQQNNRGLVFKRNFSDFYYDSIKGRESFNQRRMKNKCIDINPNINRELNKPNTTDTDCCYYCQKSEFMLIEFGSKKIHLICLIFSGNLLNFFENPQCKISTFIMFMKLVKYNLLNFLQKDDWKETIKKLKSKYETKAAKKNEILIEIRKLLIQQPKLRKEIIELGILIFKNNIINKFCMLCCKPIGNY